MSAGGNLKIFPHSTIMSDLARYREMLTRLNPGIFSDFHTTYQMEKERDFCQRPDKVARVLESCPSFHIAIDMLSLMKMTSVGR